MASVELPAEILYPPGGGVVARRPRPTVTASAESVTAPPLKITASAARVKQKDAASYRRLIQPWQTRALTYADLVPELRFAMEFHAGALGKLRLFAGEVPADDPTSDPQETENPQVQDALDRIQDPGGGRAQLQAMYGRLRFLCGECYLLVTLDDDGEEEQWEIVSVDELRINGDSVTRFAAPSIGALTMNIAPDDLFEPVDNAIAYRLWRRHPRYSRLAASNVQACLDILEELVLLTQAVRARARSRAAGAGLLYVPDELSLPPVEGVEDPFMEDLTTQLTTPIADEGSAASVVPMIVRGPYQYRDGVLPIQLHDPRETYPETGLRDECIGRLANGLDLPREILLGMGTTNHWTSWQISEDAWRAHLQPVAQELVDDLTSAYLWPLLKSEGVQDYKRYRVWYDATDVLVAPDRTGDAKDLHDRIVIGDQALRDAAGFDEDDAPTDDERARRIGVLVRDGGLAITGIPTLRPGAELEPSAGDIEAPPAPGGGIETPGPALPAQKAGPGNVSKTPPPADTRPGPASQTAAGDARFHITERILGAAEMAVERAREAAGNRILSAVQRGPKRDARIAALLAGTATSRIPAKFGAVATAQLLGDTAGLTAGANECFTRVLTDTYHVQPLAAKMITAHVERHAAKTLFEAEPIPLPAEVVGYVHA